MSLNNHCATFTKRVTGIRRKQLLVNQSVPRHVAVAKRYSKEKERGRGRKRVNGSHSLAKCNEHSQPPRRWRLTCISMHLRLHPSFAYSTSLGRAETRAPRLDTFFLDSRRVLLAIQSLSLFKDFLQATKTIHSRRHPLGPTNEG